MFKFVLLLTCFLSWGLSASARIDLYQGLVDPATLPEPQRGREMVRLDVPQVSQYMQPWCVPASVAMVLAYYGRDYSPKYLKQLSDAHKHISQRNPEVTSWLDMETGLKRIGERWKMRHYRNTKAGFYDGLRDIRKSLRRGRPVLIDVDLLTGHTFVIVGFNDEEQVVYVRDPLLKDGRMRVLTYWTLYQNWHNRELARTRSAFFSKP